MRLAVTAVLILMFASISFAGGAGTPTDKLLRLQPRLPGDPVAVVSCGSDINISGVHQSISFIGWEVGGQIVPNLEGFDMAKLELTIFQTKGIGPRSRLARGIPVLNLSIQDRTPRKAVLTLILTGEGKHLWKGFANAHIEQQRVWPRGPHTKP